LNRPPRTTNCALESQDIERWRAYGEKIWRFFHDWSSPATNWLIPDHVLEDGKPDMRLSPTNLGMLLNARIAALHFGAITLAEFVFETGETLQRVLALPKHRGHLLNWYDIATLQPLNPAFISTVDSGNLAAALWTLKQAASAFAAEPPAKRGLTPEIAAGLANIASTCSRLVREMDFQFLYDTRRRVLAVGYNAETGRPTSSAYDLLASEARIATFIAIAKGDIPQEAWFHLNRAHTLFGGESILLSWTGTMFEYLMPTIWMRHHPGTITYNSVRGVVKAQREYARQKGVPWGISESACLMGDGSYGYGPFGLPALALKRRDAAELVVSPYSAFLATAVDPAAALKNLQQLEEFGWTGRYSFYEAIDYTHSGGAPVRSWMAHHQGMSLLALCNLLFDQPLQRYFHAEPHVLATELLLHERIPAAMQTEHDELPAMPALETAPTTA
jgi:cyclic beta-1,2-glucan synthetase